MGLRIHAYRGLALMERLTDDPSHLDELREAEFMSDELVVITPNAEWCRDWAKDRPAGLYRTQAVITRDFGPCSSFNDLREELGRAVGYEFGERDGSGDWIQSAPVEGYFRDLIFFSDCEGTVGPAAAGRILRDLEEFIPMAEGREEAWSPFFLTQLYALRILCTAAAANGALVYS